jgi:hypothetical protein
VAELRRVSASVRPRPTPRMGRDPKEKAFAGGNTRKSVRRRRVCWTGTMRLGMHLRELVRLPIGVVLASALLATFAAVWSVASISLFPPGLKSRGEGIATAQTQVVVDTPYSAVLDLRQPTNDIDGLKNRAVLIGTLMSSTDVRGDIARRAGIPVERLHVVAPRTPEQPRPVQDSSAKPGPGDLLKSTDQYRLDVQANPTIPLLTIDAQAPTAQASQRLANAGISGLRDYLKGLAASDGAPNGLQVRLRQLGAARGSVINQGVQAQVAIVVFALVFLLSLLAAMLIARVRRGWQLTAPKHDGDEGRAHPAWRS